MPQVPSHTAQPRGEFLTRISSNFQICRRWMHLAHGPGMWATARRGTRTMVLSRVRMAVETTARTGPGWSTFASGVQQLATMCSA
jgi:hypothetical protein